MQHQNNKLEVQGQYNIQKKPQIFSFQIKNYKKQAQKPKNMLIIQKSEVYTRCINIHTFQQALKSTSLISLYSQIISQSNPQHPTIQYNLQQMCEYYLSMQNIMYIQKDNKTKQQKSTQVQQMQSYNKQYIITQLKQYCLKKSINRSIELAKKIFQNGMNLDQVMNYLASQQQQEENQKIDQEQYLQEKSSNHTIKGQIENLNLGA